MRVLLTIFMVLVEFVAPASAQQRIYGAQLAPGSVTPDRLTTSQLIINGISCYLGVSCIIPAGGGSSNVAADFYVSKTGSDANDCLTSGTACLTIKHAVDIALSYTAPSSAQTIHIGSGTFNESVFVNGQIAGGHSTAPNPNTGASGGYGYGGPELIFAGNGSANTIWDGPYGYCVTLGVSSYADVGLRNLKIQATAVDCGPGSKPSSVFAQMAGTVNIHEGVVFGPAGAEALHAENPGTSIQVWNDYGIAMGASSGHFIAVGGSAQVLISYGQGTISGGTAFSPFIFGYALGSIQWNIANPWVGTATGQKFYLTSGAVIETNGNTGTAQVPGSSQGVVAGSSSFRGPAFASFLSAAGFGSTATIVVGPEATPRSGKVTITPGGTGIGSSGTINISFPYRVANASSGGNPGVCWAQPSQEGSAAWVQNPAFVTRLVNNDPDYLAVNVGNNGSTWSSGSSYVFNYGCSGD